MTKTQFLLSSLILLLTLTALTSCGKKKSNQPLALPTCSDAYSKEGQSLITDITSLKELSKKSSPLDISKLSSMIEVLNSAEPVIEKCRNFIEKNPKYRGCKDSASHQVIDQRTIEKKCNFIKNYFVNRPDKSEDSTKLFNRAQDDLKKMIKIYKDQL